MRKFVETSIIVACSWIGWWVGSQLGLMTAFLLSMLGVGLGMYFGRRLVQY